MGMFPPKRSIIAYVVGDFKRKWEMSSIWWVWGQLISNQLLESGTCNKLLVCNLLNPGGFDE